MEDGLSERDAARFFDDDEYMNLSEAMAAQAPQCTRIGGVPTWIQSAGEAPPAPWRFALQIDSSHQLSWEPLTADEAGCAISRRDGEGRLSIEQPSARKAGAPASIAIDPTGTFAEGSNFGDGGIAYLFRMDVEGGRPEFQMFWQCG
jgi:hypothetical protein